MALPSKVQDTLARSLNNLTVVSDTALQELAQTVPTRQADKLQLLLNKLLERAELEASSSQAASSSGANLGPDSSSAPALDVVHTLEALDAAGGGLANDDIEQLAADPASSPSPWPAQIPADSSASGNDPLPGLQSYDPAASGGHDQSANLGAADDGADPWAGWSAAQLGQAELGPTSSTKPEGAPPAASAEAGSGFDASGFTPAPTPASGVPLPDRAEDWRTLVGEHCLWLARFSSFSFGPAESHVATVVRRTASEHSNGGPLRGTQNTCAVAASASAALTGFGPEPLASTMEHASEATPAADPTTSTSASAQAEQPSNQPDAQPSDRSWADGSWTSFWGNWWGGRGW